jgi:hypothetical protein
VSFVREPAVPQRIVQKLLTHLQARSLAPLERARALRDVLDARARSFAVGGGHLWATFARCAARGQLGRVQNAI